MKFGPLSKRALSLIHICHYSRAPFRHQCDLSFCRKFSKIRIWERDRSEFIWETADDLDAVRRLENPPEMFCCEWMDEVMHLNQEVIWCKVVNARS